MTELAGVNTIVAQALTLWDMPDAKTRLIAQRENHVYRVTHNGQSYALRLHRPGYRATRELRSELQWMTHLADQGLYVPIPIATPQGGILHKIADVWVDLLVWLEGHPIGEGSEITATEPATIARQVGREMARLHDITDAWTPPNAFARPDWTQDALLGETPLWGRFWEHPDLRPADITLLLRARDTARRDIGLLTPDTGLIHADLLAENLLIHQTRLGLIDFDDSALGYRDFELATFLLRYCERPDFSQLRASLCAGYGTRRPVDADALDLALLLRALSYVGWIAPRVREPGGAHRSKRMIARALRLAQTYVKRRGP